MKDEKGRYLPGTSGNPKGRPKGSKNRRTKQVKEEMFRWVMEVMQYGNLKEAQKNMSMKDAVVIAEKMLKHLIPSESKVKQKIEGEVNIIVNRTKKEKNNDNHDITD